MPRAKSLLLAVVAALSMLSLAGNAQAPSTVLMSNSLAAVTQADFDAELLRLPADIRDGFANSPRRVNELVGRMLLQKSLAAQARAAKLDVRPDNAKRIALEIDRLLASLELENIEATAATEFNANSARYEARARELYLVDKTPYAIPAQIKATHILFDTKKRTPDEARKLATEARAKVVAGADMNKLAREISDDPSSGQNGGVLPWLSEKELDPKFAAAAFALVKPGELAEPVQSEFGWHVIRLEEKRGPSVKPYEEAREAILAELRRRYGEEKREAAIAAIRRDPKTVVNREAVDALTPKVDPEAIRRAREAAMQTAPGAPPK